MPRLSKIGAAALAAFGWTTGGASVTVTYLVVAGGGGGGSDHAGGGGAGGYRAGTESLNPTLSYTVTVGAGGTGGSASAGGNGNNSVFNTITSTGGGGGGSGTGTRNGSSGGSGGGGGSATGSGGTGGAGNTPSTSPSQGNNGGTGVNAGSLNRAGGGGGGASAVGVNGDGSTTWGTGGAGGAGTASSISGTSVTYAGGGGGGNRQVATPGAGGAGGAGGGGAGGGPSPGTGTEVGAAGTANLGGGGGGGANAGGGGAGGSGIVIISYAGAQQFGGGVVTSSGGNTIHTFTTSGTLVPITPLSANYLVVAGGGGGGGHAGAGGGGAGGLLSGSGLVIDSNSIYTVTVGGGGTGGTTSSTNSATSGSNSSFSGYATAAVGGGFGGGGNPGNAGATGGSGGGGGGFTFTAGAGTSGQGNAGGTGVNRLGAGGGGAGAVGGNAVVTTNAGSGGNGSASSISGSSVTYAGGGGGGSHINHPNGSGGSGGGGTGGAYANPGNGGNGTTNLGGGGGGAGGQDGINAAAGGNGGSGVVIISYPGATQLMAGGTVTISGGNVIHTFTSTGFLTPIKLVNNSLRFRSSASAYLNRTNSSSVTNNKIFTYSLWVKRGSLGVTSSLLAGDNSTAIHYFGYGNSSAAADTLEFYDGQTAAWKIQTNAVYRDPSAYYHVILSVDTTQATAANRVRIYVNGVECSYATATYPAQNTVPNINVASMPLYIGRRSNASQWYFDGYLTEVNFIDGQALTPSSFGTFNSYGVWQPITYGGSYGTNGFYLPFTNKTSTTTLGYDFSPNGNNWTTNNISLTTGATYDSMTDVPTLTSATAANYAVLNPLQDSATLVNGNLDATSLSSYSGRKATMQLPTTGKWYWETTVSNTSTTAGNWFIFGMVTNSFALTSAAVGAANAISFGDRNDSVSGVFNETTTVFSSASINFATNDILQCAYDADSGKFWFGKNNSWYDSSGTTTGNPATGSNQTLTASAKEWFPFFQGNNTSSAANLNFGQRPFSFSPPSGYVALNTYNL